jgi:hypothetical protein
MSEARPDYLIPVRLLRWIEHHGYADARESLAFLTHAAKHAAPVTHPEGNKRFNDLLLTIDGRRIEDLSVFEPNCATCNDMKVFVAYDPDGTERRWPCPDCRIDKRKADKHNRRLQPRR